MQTPFHVMFTKKYVAGNLAGIELPEQRVKFPTHSGAALWMAENQRINQLLPYVLYDMRLIAERKIA